MEHRLSSRIPLNTNIVIYYNGLGLLQARSIDVSRHGMLVDTGQMNLPLYAMVDLAFPLDSGKLNTSPQRTPAMVVRLAAEGVGLMFANEITLDEAFSNSPGDDNQYFSSLATVGAV
jgi:PilZ domain